jgi:hypothetical protein
MDVTFVRLAGFGVRGNGHMMMANQDNIAPVLIGDFPRECGVPIFVAGVIVGGMGIGGGRGYLRQGGDCVGAVAGNNCAAGKIAGRVRTRKGFPND